MAIRRSLVTLPRLARACAAAGALCAAAAGWGAPPPPEQAILPPLPAPQQRPDRPLPPSQQIALLAPAEPHAASPQPEARSSAPAAPQQLAELSSPAPQSAPLHPGRQQTAQLPSPAAQQQPTPPHAAPPQRPARPQSLDEAPAGKLSVGVGKGTLIRLPAPAAVVFVADPTVADVHVPNPQAVFVLGKKSGATTLYALDAHDRTILKETVEVSYDVAALQQLLETRFPSLSLKLAASPGSLMVSGAVNTAADADAIVQTLMPYLQSKETLINRMTLTHPLQVDLRVRIAEVDRTVTQQLGVNWSAIGRPGNLVAGILSGREIQDPTTGAYQLPTNNAFSPLVGYKYGASTIQALIDALDQEGLITMLAEPNLTAISGQTASFLAGGEFPIPVAQGGSAGAISVDFKQFGVALNFTPTVMADNRISLRVHPEVSSIDTAISVTTNGITIPGLSVRRLDTTIELSSGQSFAIGGLLQSDTSNTLSELPGVGSLPVLGKLFSSRNFQDQKSELVVIVTAYLVNPTDGNRLRTPLDTLMSPSGDVEYTLQHQFGLDPLSGETPRLAGSAGFVY